MLTVVVLGLLYLAASSLNIWGALAGLALGAAVKGKKGKDRPLQGQVPKAVPGGLSSYYDDSYGPLLQSMGGPQTGTAGSLQSILQNFKGTPGDLKNFMETAAPFIAGGMANTNAFRDVAENYRKRSDTLQSYGAGASQIAQGGRQALTAGQQTLAGAGLGRSSAMAGIGSQVQSAMGAQRANLFTNLYQQQMQNQQAMAAQALDAHRMLSTLALGHAPAPRQSGGGSSDLLGPAIGAIGSIAGGLLA